MFRHRLARLQAHLRSNNREIESFWPTRMINGLAYTAGTFTLGLTANRNIAPESGEFHAAAGTLAMSAGAGMGLRAPRFRFRRLLVAAGATALSAATALGAAKGYISPEQARISSSAFIGAGTGAVAGMSAQEPEKSTPPVVGPDNPTGKPPSPKHDSTMNPGQ